MGPLSAMHRTGNVIVTNSHTVIDEQGMNRAIEQLSTVCELLAQVIWHYTDAELHFDELIGEYPTLWGRRELITQACNEARTLKERVSELREDIGMVLMIYYAAEQRVQEFFNLRAQIFPSLTSWGDWMMEVPAFPSTPLSRAGAPLRYQFPFSFLYGSRRSLAGFIPFGLSQGVDPLDAHTQQIYLRAASQDLMEPVAGQLSTDPGVQGHPHGRSYQMGTGSWWKGTSHMSAQASAAMAAVFFRYGHLRHGATTGVSIRPHPQIPRPPQVPPLTHAAPTPHHPSATIRRISKLADSQPYGQLEILKHTTPGSDGAEKRSWSVIIRGTQHWDGGGSNPQDMLSNFQAVAGHDSDQAQAVRKAMEHAGIQPGDPVEFIGHSQGGIIAAQMAADTEISDRYTVAAVLTAGAPTGRYSPITQAGMLNLENTRDLVPALDGQINNDAGNNATVYFDGQDFNLTTDDASPRFSHDIDVYAHAMSTFEESNDPRVKEVHHWLQQRNDALGFTEQTHTESYVYDTKRTQAPKVWVNAGKLRYHYHM